MWIIQHYTDTNPPGSMKVNVTVEGQKEKQIMLPKVKYLFFLNLFPSIGFKGDCLILVGDFQITEMLNELV